MPTPGNWRWAGGPPRHTQVMHGHEDRVRPDETEPEVPARHRFVHHASEHLGKPIIGRRKDAEDGGHPHDEVEMARHEVSVVQLNIEYGLREEGAADPAGNEKRDEPDRKKHG